MVNQPGFSIARKVRYPLLKTLEARESKEDAERLLREAEVGEFRCKSQQLSSSFGYEAISLKMHIYIRPHVPACKHACMACMHASIYQSMGTLHSNRVALLASLTLPAWSPIFPCRFCLTL